MATVVVLVLTLSATLSVVSFQRVAFASVTSVVPVVVCPTETGANLGAPSKAAVTARVDLSARAAKSVAIYTDKYSMQSLLGPRGWRCIASYGADGNGGVTVYPKGESVHYFADLSKEPKSFRAVNADWTPACVVCILGQACPFFSAAKTAVTTLGYNKNEVSCTRPRGQTIVLSGRSFTIFTDPPGVTGTGRPSGGTQRARGLAVWEGVVKKGQQTDINGSAIVTCTIASDAQLCQESFVWFEQHDAPKLKP
jgi:hypothetical protein